MQKIVDASYLESTELDEYLQFDKQNFVVLCEYACMESYKGNSLNNVSKAIRIISNYPDQVLVLKGTRKIVVETLNFTGRDSLVDWGQTGGFENFCTQVNQAVQGSASLEKLILDHGLKAKEHFELTCCDAKDVAQSIKMFGESFSVDELRIIRAGQRFSEGLIDDTVKRVAYLTFLMLSRHPDVGVLPDSDLVTDNYIFRFSIAAYALVLDWIGRGGIGTFPLNRLSNDVIDMHYVAYSTYFDGLLTRDKKMMRLYKKTLGLIELCT